MVIVEKYGDGERNIEIVVLWLKWEHSESNSVEILKVEVDEVIEDAGNKTSLRNTFRED